MPPSLRSGSAYGCKSAGGSRGDAKRQKELLKSLFCRCVPSASRPCGLSASRLTQETHGYNATSLVHLFQFKRTSGWEN
ncbi:MAG TPA: hypothetical protein PLL08_05605 [Bacteroidales bacterium]|nr:hypothetical protein [Bacteroidales bacterium]